MYTTFKLPGTNGAGSKLTVTTTAQSLQDLIKTASGDSDFVLKDGINSIDMSIEAEGIRWYDDGNIPTALLGNPAVNGDLVQLRGTSVSKIQMISTEVGSATVTVRIGFISNIT